MLPEKQRSTLFFFLDTLTLLTTEVQESACLDNLEERVHLALARIERDFPMSIQVNIMLRLFILHLILSIYRSQ